MKLYLFSKIKLKEAFIVYFEKNLGLGYHLLHHFRTILYYYMN